jgi:hypothetical protein
MTAVTKLTELCSLTRILTLSVLHVMLLLVPPIPVDTAINKHCTHLNLMPWFVQLLSLGLFGCPACVHSHTQDFLVWLAKAAIKVKRPELSGFLARSGKKRFSRDLNASNHQLEVPACFKYLARVSVITPSSPVSYPHWQALKKKNEKQAIRAVSR